MISRSAGNCSDECCYALLADRCLNYVTGSGAYLDSHGLANWAPEKWRNMLSRTRQYNPVPLVIFRIFEGRRGMLPSGILLVAIQNTNIPPTACPVNSNICRIISQGCTKLSHENIVNLKLQNTDVFCIYSRLLYYCLSVYGISYFFSSSLYLYLSCLQGYVLLMPSV